MASKGNLLRSTTILLLLMVSSTAGCVQPAPTATPDIPPMPTMPTSSPTPDPRQGGRLTVRLSQDVASLTPLQMADDIEAGWVMHMLYGGLSRLDDRLRPQPDLAESWTVSADGLVVTFTLRPDLRWSDGAPITAEDVRFTWSLLRIWEPRSGVQADLQEYVAAIISPAPDTAVFVLRRRLAAILTDVSFPILPRHVWGETPPTTLAETDLLENPVGSGPFMLTERRPGQALVLERNPNYHGTAPFFDQVAFLVAPDPTVAEMALRRGDLLLALLPRETYLALEATPPIEPLVLAQYPAPRYTFVGLNMHPEHIFEDPLLRQAWALSLDRETLVAEATTGEGIPLWSPILPTSWAYDPDASYPQQNLQRARDLLEEAGWFDQDGDGIREKGEQRLEVRLFVRADVPERVRASRKIAIMLAQVGFYVEVIPADFDSVITAKLRPPYDFDALCMQWRNLSPDPDPFLLFHSSQAWGGAEDKRENLYNFVGYRSEEADRLLITGRDTYDLDKRQDIYGQFQRLLVEDTPYYVLWGDPIYLAASARLTTADGPLDPATPSLFWNVERWYLER